MTKTRHKYTLGIDLGDRTCHLVIVTGAGGEEDITVVETGVIETTEAALAAWLQGRAPMRVIVEVGSHARWIAQMLEGRGHEVVVCNPRNLPEVYNNPKKSDVVDAETLARIGHTDASKLVKLVDFTGRDVASLAWSARATAPCKRARRCLAPEPAQPAEGTAGGLKSRPRRGRNGSPPGASRRDESGLAGRGAIVDHWCVATKGRPHRHPSTRRTS